MPMNTEEQEALDHAAFAAAFDEDMTVEQPDDFDIPEDGADQPSNGGPTVTLEEPDEISEEDVETDTGSEPVEESAEPAETADVEGAETGDAGEDGEQEEVLSDKDAQRKASWEGRLRAREAELARREAELKAQASQHAEEEEPGESPQHEAQETPTQEAVEETVEQVANKDVDEALAVLSEDFGEEFAKTIARLIEAKAAEIVGKTVEEKVGKVSQNVEQFVKNISDDKAREHFEAISDVHPDFMEVGESPEFKEYIDSLDETKAEKARGIVSGGSARQVIRLINDFKKAQESKPQAQQEDEQAVASAEGVRSRGLKIPEKPAPSNDYEAAWDQF